MTPETWAPVVPTPKTYYPTFRIAEGLPQIVEDYSSEPERVIAPPKDANLVCSDLYDNFGPTGFHMPVLDIDLPAQLLESSTPGHYHLLLGVSIPWSKYVDLLHALYAAGIIEEGFYNASKRRGYSAVRTPWSKKEPNA